MSKRKGSERDNNNNGTNEQICSVRGGDGRIIGDITEN